MICKYSKEDKIALIDLPILNTYRKLRFSYLIPDLKFRIDLTFRNENWNHKFYIFNDNSKIGMEFELIKKYSDEEYNKLLFIIYNFDYISFSFLKIKFNFTKLNQVGVLNNIIIKNIIANPENYLWNDKLDGQRCIVIIYNYKVFSFSIKEQLKQDDEIDIPDLSIFDCE